MHDKILDFIKRRFPHDCNWTTGNCYYFALILYDRFEGEILYDVILGHFVFKYEDKIYDWNGVNTECKNLIPWADLNNYDKQVYRRIIRDCIM